MVGEIAKIIREIHARGVPVVLVEQNASLALKLASYGYVLETGHVALEGPAARLNEHDHVRKGLSRRLMPMPWRPADLLWERWMAAAGRAWAAGRHAEAAELWRAARAGAEAFAGADPRRATGLDALGSLALGTGDRAAARRHWRDALVAWDAALPWVEAMAVVEGARQLQLPCQARGTPSPGPIRRSCGGAIVAPWPPPSAGSEANLGALDGDRAALGEALVARRAAFGSARVRGLGHRRPARHAARRAAARQVRRLPAPASGRRASPAGRRPCSRPCSTPGRRRRHRGGARPRSGRAGSPDRRAGTTWRGSGPGRRTAVGARRRRSRAAPPSLIAVSTTSPRIGPHRVAMPPTITQIST